MSYNPPLIFGPIAPENNPPINPQYYQPRVFNIANIVNGVTTLLTTTVPHDYVVGQNVRLLISLLYNATEFNEREATVVSIPTSSSMVLQLDSRGFSAFVPNTGSNSTQPQVVAVGDYNSGVINANGRILNGTFIPGSFIDISPA